MPRFLLCFLLTLLVSTSVHAEDAGLARIFREHGVDGTLVITSLDGKTSYSHNDTKAALPILPASTFKIPNTLIALDSEAVGAAEILKWNGKESGLPACNHDLTLEPAFKYSCIWFYQDLARRIGTERYRAYLAGFRYGNAKPGPVLTTFWLDGELRISALDQVEFLKRVYRRELPVKPAAYEVLAKAMEIEKRGDSTVFAKSGWVGWGSNIWPQTGWYVGYVTRGKDAWFFAEQVEMKAPAQAALRRAVVVEALQEKDILPKK